MILAISLRLDDNAVMLFQCAFKLLRLAWASMIVCGWVNLAEANTSIPRVADLGLDPERTATVVGEHMLLIAGKPRPIHVFVEQKPQEHNGRFITALIVIPKPVSDVRQMVADFTAYPQFVPQTAAAKILRHNEQQTSVDFKLSIDVGVIKIGLKFIADYTFEHNGDITWVNREGDFAGSLGRFEFFTLSGQRTLLAYTSWTNFETAGFLVRTAMKLQPDLLVALPASTAAVIMRAYKERLSGALVKPAPVASPRIPIIGRGDLPVAELGNLAQLGTLAFVYAEQTIQAKGQIAPLAFVSGGALVNAPIDTAKKMSTQFARFPEFFDQVVEAKSTYEGKRHFVDWKLKLDFGFLKIPIYYRLEYADVGMAWPFRVAGGDLEFIYGAWEWIEVSPQQTLIIYTTASSPGKNGAAILKFADLIPNNQMITGIAVATVVVERQAPWIEKNLAVP